MKLFTTMLILVSSFTWADSSLYPNSSKNTYVDTDARDEQQVSRISKYQSYAQDVLQELALDNKYEVLREDIFESGSDIYKYNFKAQEIKIKIFIRSTETNEVCELTRPSWMDYVTFKCISDGENNVFRHKIEGLYDTFNSNLGFIK